MPHETTGLLLAVSLTLRKTKPGLGSEEASLLQRNVSALSPEPRHSLQETQEPQCGHTGAIPWA